jgi:hypothetical protein
MVNSAVSAIQRERRRRRRETVMTTAKTPASRNPMALLLRSLTRDLSSAYRPEQHYMRGPGPKWREKHAPPQQQPDMVDLRSTKPAV